MKDQIIERIESLKKENEDNHMRLNRTEMEIEKVIEWNSSNDEKEKELAKEIINFIKLEIGIVKGRMKEIDDKIVFLINLLEIDTVKRGIKLWKKKLSKELNP